MPLTDPVPSSAFDVLERNIQDTDKFMNQETGTFTNRIGKQIKPIPVIEAEANAAVISLGWVPVGEFATGFTYTKLNDVGRDSSGSWWRYNGSDLPKVIAAGTVPSSPNFSVISFETADNVFWETGKSVGYALDDLQGFTDELFAQAGTVDSGMPDAIGNSQRMDALTAIFDKSFPSYSEMLTYTKHKDGLRYSTGGTAWEVNTSVGAPLGGGLFVKPLNAICVLDFGVDNSGASTTSAQFRAMYSICEQNGWLSIEVPSGIYSIDGLASPDEYKTGWLIPWDDIFQYSPVVNINIAAGAQLYATSADMIMIRASKDNVKFTGSGSFNGGGNLNVIGIAYCPEDLNQATTQVSQQFGYVEETLNGTGLFAWVMSQCGPTVGGQDSGSFYHVLGGRVLSSSYTYWAKNTLTTEQNITTRTSLVGMQGKDLVSSCRIDAGEIRMNNCNFELMSGEIVEYKLKGDVDKIIDNSLHIYDTVFEVYALATQLNEYGVTIGEGVKFIGGLVQTSGISSPVSIPSRVAFGSGNGAAVPNHSKDTSVHGPSNVRTVTENLDGITGVYTISGTNVAYVNYIIKTKFNLLELNVVPFDLSRGTHSSAFGHGVYIQNANDGVTHFNKQEGTVGANYKLHYMENSGGTPVYEVRGNGDVFNLTGTYGMLSDERTKKDFTPCRDYTDDLMKVEVGTYISLVDDSKCIGVKAGDFKEIFPSLVPAGEKPIMVNGEEIENPLHVNQSPLIYMLLDAFKRQELKIRDQEDRISKLESI